jgi:hybrid cluster-associated redox disulfide protein
MTIAEAMTIHPAAAQVFAAFHLGGCAHCHVNRVETLEQVCASNGIETADMLEALEGLFEE